MAAHPRHLGGLALGRRPELDEVPGRDRDRAGRRAAPHLSSAWTRTRASRSVRPTNPGWKEVVATRAPANLTLDVGQYHVVVEKFRDFNASEADMSVSPGHVHQLKANLSQGKFMAFLRVSSNVIGAHVWIDDKKKEHPLWGDTPHGELVPGGKHDVLVEAPGFEPFLSSVELEHGEQKELEVRMVRVNYGVLRIDASAPEVKVRIDEQPKGVWHSGEEPLDVRFDAGEHKLTSRATVERPSRARSSCRAVRSCRCTRR